jgi:hypothetical protein
MEILQNQIAISNMPDVELLRLCHASCDLTPLEKELLRRFDTAHDLIVDMKEFGKDKLPTKEIPHGYDGS